MSRILARLVTSASLLLLVSCGEGVVQVDNLSYEPRIVVEGLLLPDHPVKIRISRNFPITADLTRLGLLLANADAKITDEASSESFKLSYQPVPSQARPNFFETYYTAGPDLVIRPGATYSLEVSAGVGGQRLSARASTTVPEEGFEIVGVNRDRLAYRERDASGETIDLKLVYERSPGTTFYLLTAVPLTPSVDTFVFDNPFADESRGSLDLPDYMYESEWSQNTPVTAGRSTMNIFWWDLWFYGRHKIVVYAADKNYANFIQTFEEVEEEDGNFHEPVFNFEGDAIGYFGSAIADSTFIEIIDTR